MKKVSLSLVPLLWIISVSSCSMISTDPLPPSAEVDGVAGRATTGKVAFTLLGDSVQNGILKSSALSGVSVYNGYYSGGALVGTTDSSGKATVSLPAGTSVYVTFFKMTSSHSALFGQQYLAVAAGSTASSTVHLCPTQVEIIAHYSVPYGKALYVTGETSWLGSWGTAAKMSYRCINGESQWYLQANLPIGAQFKVVMADWVDGASRSVSGVSWMKQGNATIAAPSTSYESVNDLWPTF